MELFDDGSGDVVVAMMRMRGLLKRAPGPLPSQPLQLLDTHAVGVRREKMYKLDGHIACAVAGMTGACRCRCRWTNRYSRGGTPPGQAPRNFFVAPCQLRWPPSSSPSPSPRSRRQHPGQPVPPQRAALLLRVPGAHARGAARARALRHQAGLHAVWRAAAVWRVDPLRGLVRGARRDRQGGAVVRTFGGWHSCCC